MTNNQSARECRLRRYSLFEILFALCTTSESRCACEAPIKKGERDGRDALQGLGTSTAYPP